MRAASLLLAGAMTAGGAAAQVDPGAPEGALRTAQTLRDLDSYAAPVGAFGLDAPAVRRVEGAVSWAAYRLDDAQASVAGVMRDYRERLGALGFQPVFSCANEACGGFDFRFEAEILPPPGMLVDVRDFAQLTAERDDPEGLVSVLVSRVLDKIHIQTVAVSPPVAAEAAADASAGIPADDAVGSAPAKTPAGAADTPADDAADMPVDPPIEPAAAVPEVPSAETAPGAPAASATPPQDEGALLAQLMEDGHVPVAGLDFEVGGAGLSASSAGALDSLARLLVREEGVAVAIVGHSDNQGGLELNLELSRRRAEAVMQALIDRGVPARQVEARGIGYLAPVASNATEEGRARNRRVELVLR